MKDIEKTKQKKQTCSLMNLSKSLELFKEGGRDNLNRISDKYSDITKKLFFEKAEFHEEKYLRNIDVTLETGKNSRKMRRIVEKRMSQAWSKQFKGLSKEDSGNYHRSGMIRAISYQLYNMGQIENNLYRGMSSHWKKAYDNITKQYVLKKKCQYGSIEEAETAVQAWKQKHIDDTKQLVAYKCCECGCYHIGHMKYENTQNNKKRPA